MGTQCSTFSPGLPIAIAESRRWREQALRVLGLTGTAVLLGCVAAYAWVSRGWPLVNDPALMHYIVFLTGQGAAPYRQIGDYNLPGSYAPEWLSMTAAALLHVSEAAMWRVFDLGAVLLSGIAMFRIARPRSRFAGIWSGALFALYHGRDGIGQAGQRDLWMTLLLLWAVALIFAAMRGMESRGTTMRVAGAAACIGAAATIKPQAAAWLLCMLPLLRLAAGRRWKLAGAAAAGAVIPVSAAAVFLVMQGATAAFWHALWVELPYHVSLARGSVAQLVGASSISSIAKLLLLGAAAWVVTGGRRREAGSARLELPLLALATLLGLLSFVAQGKGYAYQRYPYIAFLLLTLALVFARALASRRRMPMAVGVAGLGFGVLGCAPAYLHHIEHARWSTPALRQMEHSIAAAAGPGGLRALNGRVQCLDTVSGCTDALLHLRLRQSTGVLYDELLFPQSPDGWTLRYGGPAAGTPLPPAVAQARAGFRQSVEREPPRVIVLSAWLFPEGPGDYRELRFWPWLSGFLEQHYALVSEHAFAQSENGPLGFRVYRLRAASQSAQPGD